MTDFSKYGKSIEDVEGKKSSSFSKYGIPATPEVVPPQEQGVKGMEGRAVGVAKGLLGTFKGMSQQGESIGRGILGGVEKLTGLPVNPPETYTEKALQQDATKGGFLGKLLNEGNLKSKSPEEKQGKIIETVAELVPPGAFVKGALKSFKTLSYLKNTPETLSKAEEKVASLAGRVKETLLSRKKYIVPSETEKRAAQLLDGKISSIVTKNPLIIQKEIATRGAEVENALSKAPKPITPDEQLSMWVEKRKSMEKNLDKSQLKAFDEQFKMFLKQISDSGVVETDTAKYYKAVKDYETNVASNLPRGKATLLDPTGVASAKIQGAKAVREIVRDTIGSKHPEFKGKMFDLASLYDVLDTALTKSRQLSGNALSRFTANNPVLSNIAKIGGGILVGKSLLKDKSGTEQSSYNPTQ
jgi:hypothetical protein